MQIKSYDRPFLINSIMYNFTSWIYAFFAILSLWPFFSWKWPIIPVSFIAITYFCYLYDFIFIAVLNKRILAFKFFVVFLILFFWLISYAFFPGGIPPWFNYYSLFSLLLLLFSTEKILDIATKFKLLFCLSLLPGLVVYLLLIIGVNLPYSILDAHNELKDSLGIVYRDYGVTIALSHLILEVGNSTLVRFSGIYDEPGLIGTICALLLLADKFNLRSKQNIVLLVSGVLSMSLVFYLFFFLGLIVQGKRRILNLFILFAFCLIIYNSPIYDNFFQKRFEVNSSGQIAADNRVSQCFQLHYDVFLSSEPLRQLFGSGNNAHLDTNCDVSSYKMYIYDYGFIGFSVILLLVLFQYFSVLFFTGFIRYYLISSIVFISAFFISYYQRPVFFNLAFCLVFYCSISFFYAQLKNKK